MVEAMEDRITPTITIGLDLPATSLEGDAIAVTATTNAGTPSFTWTVTKDGADFASGDTSTVSFTPDDNGTYAVSLTVTGIDPDTAASSSATATDSVDVTNTPPSIAPLSDATIDEGQTFTAHGTFTDLGTADTFTATVDYGDGTGVQSLSVNPDNSFDLSHAFAGTGSFTVTVTVTDDDGGSGSDTFLVTVNNLPPVVSIDGPDVGVRGQTLSFTLTATDASATPTTNFTFDIDWNGDGVVDETVTGPSGTVVTHTFSELGTNTISVTATDAGGATSLPAELTVEIKVAAIMDDPLNPGHTLLAVGGTDGNDTILINPARGLNAMVNGQSVGRFSGVERIAIFGGAGDDTIRLAGSIRVNAWLDGGDGNDQLKGGKGSDVLMGGEGDDTLQGTQGQDILIGGAGLDTLNGGPGDDILIGGQLLLGEADLFTVTQAWAGGGTFADRVDTLQNGTVALTAGTTDATVVDDGDADQLQGAAGMNWFFASSDTDTVLGNKHKALITDLVDGTTSPGSSGGNAGNGNGGNGNAGNGGNGNGGNGHNGNGNGGNGNGGNGHNGNGHH